MNNYNANNVQKRSVPVKNSQEFNNQNNSNRTSFNDLNINTHQDQYKNNNNNNHNNHNNHNNMNLNLNRVEDGSNQPNAGSKLTLLNKKLKNKETFRHKLLSKERNSTNSYNDRQRSLDKFDKENIRTSHSNVPED